MDRSREWLEAVDKGCQNLHLPHAEVTRIKASIVLRPPRTETQFSAFAGSVAKSIAELSDLIQAHQQGYLSSSVYSNAEKDNLENEVSLFVKTCAQQVDRLKQSVLASQQQQDNHGKLRLNAQAAAHLHGVVLVLAESLQHTAAVFDGLRVQRYRQKVQEQERKRRQDYKSQAPQQHASGNGWLSRPAISEQASFMGTSQQQQFLADENKSLVAHLQRTGQNVMGIEQSALEISTLNQLFSAAISSQAAAIEEIYDNAVQASEYVRAGNEDLGHAIQINRSSRYYILVMLLVATFCLLFFDWLNS